MYSLLLVFPLPPLPTTASSALRQHQQEAHADPCPKQAETKARAVELLDVSLQGFNASRVDLGRSRHASVAENRKRRKLTSDEQAEEATQARIRLSSVKMAEEKYA